MGSDRNIIYDMHHRSNHTHKKRTNFLFYRLLFHCIKCMCSMWRSDNRAAIVATDYFNFFLNKTIRNTILLKKILIQRRSLLPCLSISSSSSMIFVGENICILYSKCHPFMGYL